MKVDIIKDVSALTGIDENHLHKLVDKAVYCAANAVDQDQKAGESITTLSIGIGDLLINVDSTTGQIKYRFVPSDKLSKILVDTIVNQQNPLKVKLEQSLVRNIIDIYKELF